MRVADSRPDQLPGEVAEGSPDPTRAYRIVAIVMVVMLCTIIVSGAIVRLSNSGLGCSDWPRCEPGHFTSLGSINQRIEQFNRFYSGLIIVPILVSLLLAYLMKPRRRDLLVLSWTLVVLYLFEAVLGGVAVLVDLQWVSVMSHFLLAIVLLGVSLVNLDRARAPRTPEPPPPDRATRWLVAGVWFAVLTIIVLGTLVTAAGPHGGDRLHAARLRWPIEDAARTHGIAVNITLALVLYLIWRLRREHHATGVHVVGLLLAAMFVQAGIGYIQWWEQIPPVLVGFHVAGATIVFVAATWMLLTLVVRPAQAASAYPSDVSAATGTRSDASRRATPGIPASSQATA